MITDLEVDRTVELEALRAECAELRKKLAAAEELRDLYLRGLYEIHRKTHPVEEIDFDELAKRPGVPLAVLSSESV